MLAGSVLERSSRRTRTYACQPPRKRRTVLVVLGGNECVDLRHDRCVHHRLDALAVAVLPAVHEERHAGGADEQGGISLLNIDVIDGKGLGVEGGRPRAEQQPEDDCDTQSAGACRRAVWPDNHLNTTTLVGLSPEHLDGDRILRPDAVAVNRDSGTAHEGGPLSPLQVAL